MRIKGQMRRKNNFLNKLVFSINNYIFARVTNIVPTEKEYCYNENRLSASHRIFLHGLRPLIRDVVNDRSRVCLVTNANKRVNLTL